MSQKSLIEVLGPGSVLKKKREFVPRRDQASDLPGRKKNVLKKDRGSILSDRLLQASQHGRLMSLHIDFDQVGRLKARKNQLIPCAEKNLFPRARFF